MQFSVLGRHGPGRQIHPVLWIWDVPSEVLTLIPPLSFDPLTESLLSHICVNCPCLPGQSLVFFDVGHQSDPSEDSNKYIDVSLDPL